MKNTFGNAVFCTLFGESHGPSVGVVLDGLAPGLDVNEETIAAFLIRRRPQGEVSTSRVEQDRFVIDSGVFNGKTTGTPICIRIPNEAAHSCDYEGERMARPGHADMAAHYKYHGYEDYRGGGHFSGRITAALVAAGGILIPALNKKGITVESRIRRVGGVDFSADGPDSDAIQQVILDAKEKQDSVGGVVEVMVRGLPAGVGEPWFDSVEGVLSHALFSIPAIKGVSFGDGFALADMRGSEANDAWRVDGVPVTVTNHNGGINGGVTNGMPIVFRCAVKPTSSIAMEQNSVSISTGLEGTVRICGRHDPCIVPRIGVVVESVTALVLCDLLAVRYGTDWLGAV